MKKLIKVFAAALLVTVMIMAFSGCGKSGNIKSAFENAGYEITAVAAKDSEDLTGLLKKDEHKADIDKYEVFTCKNAMRTATVIKFPSADLIPEVLGESTFKTKSDGGYVNGDCYLISSCTDALNIFKNA